MKQITLGDNVIIEQGAVIGKGKEGIVKIGEDTIICANAIIHCDVIIGKHCIIGDGACIRSKVTIGDYTVIGRAATIENNTIIGNRVKMQAYAYVTAYCKVDDDVFLAPGVLTSNDNQMGRTDKQFTEQNGCHICRGARIGLGTRILPNITIGENSFVAAGSLVTKNVPKNTYVMGSPAKYYKDTPMEERI